MLLYIAEAKKGCKKKSLNILSLAAYLLKCFKSGFNLIYLCVACFSTIDAVAIKTADRLKLKRASVFLNYVAVFVNEPPCEKTGLRGFRPGPTQTGLWSHRRWLEA